MDNNRANQALLNSHDILEQMDYFLLLIDLEKIDSLPILGHHYQSLVQCIGHGNMCRYLILFYIIPQHVQEADVSVDHFLDADGRLGGEGVEGGGYKLLALSNSNWYHVLHFVRKR